MIYNFGSRLIETCNEVPVVGSYPLSSQAPTHVEVELGYDYSFGFSHQPIIPTNSLTIHTPPAERIEGSHDLNLKQDPKELY
jgi:hypothetical protein